MMSTMLFIASTGAEMISRLVAASATTRAVGTDWEYVLPELEVEVKTLAGSRGVMVLTTSSARALARSTIRMSPSRVTSVESSVLIISSAMASLSPEPMRKTMFVRSS